MTTSPPAGAGFPLGFAGTGVRRLALADFRSFATLDVEISDHIVVLTGDNGAGKTNALEALSLLSPGRGLRRAELADCARKGGGGGFAVSVELSGPGGKVRLGTGLEPQPEAPPARKFRIDREPAPSIRAFGGHVRVVWLTPAMDGLFTGPAGERRRFLDRLVLALDPEHGARVNAFERALRGRNRLLEEGRSAGDGAWLDAIEREVAELGVAIAAARVETLARLSALILAGRERDSPFPWAGLALRGEIEALVGERPALEAEDLFRGMLRANRTRDAAAGRTLIGPQASDLQVRHGPKGAEAAQASTGEQKALLVGLVLAHARLVEAASGIAPLILLDEIAAHFDPLRRSALYDLLANLGGQIWLTGADAATFAELESRAQMLRVTTGRMAPLA
ncbi:DNA replication/repair protein RecF [Methylocapsa palsarum]|uniref:DNA replication and repair protein RecF n=1 Tax=Methylocapsa palsarum TaxID=1612308 RepID=A0A1I3VRH0_9HYPH|nr:DNA replication/repair protein RecF [Methylocapsa palsarum]SFJ97739.1 DNA replication and repair protein RecF [Methylocapsa palsarum]